jgi:hypothetical protein
MVGGEVYVGFISKSGLIGLRSMAIVDDSHFINDKKMSPLAKLYSHPRRG